MVKLRILEFCLKFWIAVYSTNLISSLPPQKTPWPTVTDRLPLIACLLACLLSVRIFFVTGIDSPYGKEAKILVQIALLDQSSQKNADLAQLYLGIPNVETGVSNCWTGVWTEMVEWTMEWTINKRANVFFHRNTLCCFSY